MTTDTSPGAPASASPRAVVRTLALLEAGRFARHPLFLLGVALTVVNTVSLVRTEPVGVGLMGEPIVPAMTLGVFGLIVADRLTRSTAPLLAELGGTPVPERTRTAALALACGVPAAVAAVWTVFMLTYFSANRPVPQAWWYDTLPVGDIVSFYVAAAVVAAYGGSVLGVVVGRWLRWPGAPLVVAVLLVAVTIPGSGIVEAFRPYRQVMPWTAWYGGDDGAGADLYYPGDPRWWLVYTVCLCVLGVLAALLHDRGQPRRRLLAVGAVVGAVAVAVSLLSMTSGPQETVVSPPVLHPEQLP